MRLRDHLHDRRVGVALSSAFFGFFAHTGFLRALADAGVRPAAYSGTSAGALAAAFAASGRPLDEVEAILRGLRRRDFWDPSTPRGRPLGLLRGRKFAALLDRHLPVAAFEECATPLLTVSTNLDRRARHVDQRGPIAPAVLASCALPILFQPVVRDGEHHVDGGLLDKVPLRALLDAHPDLDCVLVHLIPSHGLSKPTPRAPWKLLDHALDWVRDDGWRQQLDYARATGREVWVVETPPTTVGPFRLELGGAAIEAGRAATAAALAGPATTRGARRSG